ncbi:hypothetical protein ABZP36_020773 [Zizania latifolia]
MAADVQNWAGGDGQIQWVVGGRQLEIGRVWAVCSGPLALCVLIEADAIPIDPKGFHITVQKARESVIT